MKKFLMLFTLVTALSFTAFAQYPTNPNPTGKQTVPYSNQVFSATFNGNVTVSAPTRNPQNTSTSTDYSSQDLNVAQSVTVRYIDHDIPVDYTSSDYYVNDLAGCDAKSFQSQGTWGGHPFSYVFCTSTSEGTKYSTRVRFIIVNSRTVVMIKQTSAFSYDDSNQWFDFEYSLRTI